MNEILFVFYENVQSSIENRNFLRFIIMNQRYSVTNLFQFLHCAWTKKNTKKKEKRKSRVFTEGERDRN